MAVLSAAYKGGNPLTLFKGDTPIKGGVAEPPTRLTLNGQTITLNSQPITKAA